MLFIAGVTDQVDTRLYDWKHLRPFIFNGSKETRSLLLGNGASLAVWDDFGYKRLCEVACQGHLAVHLNSQDQAIFRELDTSNFEAVLSAITTTRLINEVLNISTGPLEVVHDRIRSSLFHAVNEIHIPHALLSPQVKSKIVDSLLDYRNVFSTNYDVINYWSSMTRRGLFKDFFWGPDNSFDESNIEIRDSAATLMHYLHGAIHIFRSPSGTTYKRIGSLQDGGLVEQFKSDEWAIPVCISEGTWQQKRSSIMRDDYLRFSLRQLSHCPGHIVVFGQGLDEKYDRHIIDALNQRRENGIYGIVAVSIFTPSGVDDVDIQIARLKKCLKNCRLKFFDSMTHPLGCSSLKIAKPS